MIVHKREALVRKAELKLTEAVLDVVKDLTEGEVLRVLVSVLGGHLGSLAKWQIRAERHPEDPDKPGGVE